MKRFRKLLIAVLCLAMLQVPQIPVLGAQTVQAATVKKGLQKENGAIYYYVNGKKVKNTWKTVGNYKYYFGSNYKAYKAPVTKDYVTGVALKYNIVVKTIGGKKYGFDKNGRMVKGIYVVDATAGKREEFCVFNSKTGVYNASASKKLNNYLKEAVSGSTDAKKLAGFKNLRNTLRSTYNQTCKLKKGNVSCFKYDPKGKKTYYDYDLIFTRYTIQFASSGSAGSVKGDNYMMIAFPN